MALHDPSSGLNLPPGRPHSNGITARDVVFVTVPLGNVNYTTPTGLSAVLWNQSQASRLFAEIQGDQPVIRPAPPRSRGHGHRHRPHPGGWVPPGARTAAQAACPSGHR